MKFFTRTVQEIMTRQAVWATAANTIQEVAALMDQHNCGEIPVCDANNKVIGVITDRDITCRAVAKGKLPAETSVSEIMTTPAVTVDVDAPLSKAVFLMQERNVRRLPVIDLGGRLVGMLSQVDVASRSSEVDAGRLLAHATRAQH